MTEDMMQTIDASLYSLIREGARDGSPDLNVLIYRISKELDEYISRRISISRMN